MEKSPLRSSNNGTSSGITSNGRDRSGGDGGLLRASSEINTRQATSTDFVLQWGNRKRLRCMKVQVKDDSAAPAHRTTVRVVRTDKDTSIQPSTATANNINGSNNHGNGYFNLRQRPSSPPPPPPQRILRNTENSSAMRGQSNGGGVRGFASPDRGAHDKRGTRNNNHHTSNNNNNNHNHDYNKSGASSETAHDSKKGGSSSASGEAAPSVWPPKFVIALTNKEKEEDFMAIKGSKLPQRPKKRAKFIQRTLNLVSPGAWLCDLTLERYEVREKKISKKRPRGLKAMGNMDSDSE
ncbi:probable serine/threonine-protein kinase DDB_G0292354 isoform X2 [Pistacia vera]|uniref:probable serine/threonine-protein kinase DDB_G0292354 isoform X2 n=1 Tax=Pistacia vera TaxID=55513 RepID=UPI001262DCF5|nr:probable serine/threonine-protein kinase DDB_G0292354 isoform X2 [Pistacia vera]